MTAPAPAVIVFAKYPAPGEVKTRLAERLGNEPAARFAETFLLDLLEGLGSAPALAGARRYLFFDPPPARAAFQALLKNAGMEGWELAVQATGDLGARLKDALGYVCDPDPCAAAFLGSDCPELPPAEVAKSLTTAAGGRAAMCPAADGGYVLLALPAGTPDEVFDGVPWSVPETGARQFRRLAAAGLQVELGETYTDIDTHADLCGMKARLALTPSRCPRTWKEIHAQQI